MIGDVSMKERLMQMRISNLFCILQVEDPCGYVKILFCTTRFVATGGDPSVRPKFCRCRKHAKFYYNMESVNMNVPTLDLKEQYKNLKPEIDKAIQEVFTETNFILGKQVGELERRIASLCNVKFGIGVANGTDALFLALKGLGIRQGDEVITTPFTFFATAETIANCGATPVFVDIEQDTFNIDVALIKKHITKKTKAILPVHLFGHSADMDPIMAIAKEHNLFVVEDCAQAIGATYKGKPVGSFGDAGCFSFYPTKNLGGYGDGGMVVTNNEKLYDTIKSLRVHGSGSKRYYHDMLGFNSRLDTLQAAILLVKLNYLNEWTESRRKVAAFYNEKLSGLPIILPHEKSYARHVYHQYTIRVKDRERMMEQLKGKGVGAMTYYPLSLHKQKVFQSLGLAISNDCLVSSKCEAEVLSLPVYPELSTAQLDYVASSVRECVLQIV